MQDEEIVFRGRAQSKLVLLRGIDRLVGSGIEDQNFGQNTCIILMRTQSETTSAKAEIKVY